MPTKLELHR